LFNFFDFDMLQFFGFEPHPIAANGRTNLAGKAAFLDFLIEAVRRPLAEKPDRGTRES
jgi:hypothetical protein